MYEAKPVTVNLLKELVDNEIKKGNGNKVIMISNDDEGNGYHYMWFHFTPATEIYDIENSIYKDIAPVENTIILG